MLLRLAYLGVTSALALLRLLPMSDRDKDAEILALRHQVMVLQRQLHGDRVRLARADRARMTFSAPAVLSRVSVSSLRMVGGYQLIVVTEKLL
ncbi:hypothetical protein ODJ79_44725 [Actinoplanes sp. KI2]|uniref:hypothetical protein n=1 Tax=Actinoplanes sp. KI2 TaxID=2983315 RepID=UPI0021D5DB41|nr:hypothetical protein [Actinoplanes sp. KI2]MCU7730863.1 hypothetical protein [Actinoplanes sp. KI2]